MFFLLVDLGSLDAVVLRVYLFRLRTARRLHIRG
jgi:hypothetical protein